MAQGLDRELPWQVVRKRRWWRRDRKVSQHVRMSTTQQDMAKKIQRKDDREIL
jgi:hypothetical protein